MNYLRNKQFPHPRRKKRIITFLFFLFLALLLIISRKPIINFAGNLFQDMGYVIWPNSNKAKNLSDYGYLFKTKRALNEENRNLKNQLFELTARETDYALLADENIKLKEIFNRKEDRNLTLAAILAKPSRSPYDTLIIDLGFLQGIKVSQKVFAQGNVLIGQVFEVYANTSKVKLYSSPGEKTDALISGKDVYVQATGRGGQNFEITLPQDFEINIGDQIIAPSMNSQVLGIALEVISDPRDPLKKVLLRSPINIQEIKFVQIESQK